SGSRWQEAFRIKFEFLAQPFTNHPKSRFILQQHAHLTTPTYYQSGLAGRRSRLWRLGITTSISMVIEITASGNIAPLCDSHTLGLWRV
ncbi:hypothetical protein, partial [Aeromonas sobria]|uniref:hypothetical protein n=1 Tax=Aeromonas sobria TaxID=646 RepID=UPI001C31569F